jgi:hypothetical protein
MPLTISPTEAANGDFVEFLAMSALTKAMAAS